MAAVGRLCFVSYISHTHCYFQVQGTTRYVLGEFTPNTRGKLSSFSYA